MDLKKVITQNNEPRVIKNIVPKTIPKMVIFTIELVEINDPAIKRRFIYGFD